MRLFVRAVLPLLMIFLLSPISSANSGIITTYAGPGTPADGSLAVDQVIDGPSAVVSDGSGGFYLASSSQNRIYRITADGRTYLIAGCGNTGFSGDGGPAISASLSGPSGLAFDSAGNLFISDTGNHRIRIVTPEGIIRTFAGNGTEGYYGDGSHHPTKAELSHPLGINLDAAGDLYIADSGNHRIRKITDGLNISTIAGNGGQGYDQDDNDDEDDDDATSSQLNHPTGVAVDSAGTVYIVDNFNQRIRKVVNGTIYTVAGNGSAGFSGDGKQAALARLNYPTAIALDGSGNLFIADSYNFRIRKIATGGIVSTVAGNGKGGFSGDGGSATAAQLGLPVGIAVDANGNLLIADYSNQRVRRVASSGVITTVAGAGTQGFSGDGGSAADARFYLPSSVAADSAGNLYIADSLNGRIRKVTSAGTISTVAGSEIRGYSGDGGQAAAAALHSPSGVAVDADGNLYIADPVNQRVRKVTADGAISTVAGSGIQGFSGDGRLATSGRLNQPWSVAVDAHGNLYIADLINHRIRKVTSDGLITTVAGMGRKGFSGDGGNAIYAQLSFPTGVAVDSEGSLYIADSGNHRVRKVTPSGIIGTVAGTGLPGFAGDGEPAETARLYRPTSVATDSAGNLFIVDRDNNRIRKVTKEGIISTVAGDGTAGFSGDGGPAASAQVNYPMGIAIDQDGNLFIADYDNNRIRKVTFDLSGDTGVPALSDMPE